MAVLALTAGAVWAIYALAAEVKEAPRYSFLESETVRETLAFDFLILREETVVTAPKDGLFVPLAPEGERLAAGEIYALIVPESAADDVRRYRELEAQELEARLACFAQAETLAGPRRLAADLTAGAADAIREALSTKEMPALARALTDLDRVLRENNGRVRTVTETETCVPDELREARRLLRRELTAMAGADGILKTVRPAQLYFEVGEPAAFIELEATPPESLTAKAVQSAMVALDGFVPITRVDQPVTEGMPIARAVTGRRHTLAAPDPDDAFVYEQDAVYDFVAPDGTEGRAVLRRVVPGEPKLYLFETIDIPADGGEDRVWRDTALVLHVSEGLGVPVSGLTDWDRALNRAVLTVVRGGMTQRVMVDVTAYNEKYALIQVSPLDPLARGDDPLVLSESDVYVVNPRTIDEGVLIE